MSKLFAIAALVAGANAGGIGADMNPGLHRGYSPMAH
jgi:hypothetical protein